MIYFKIVTEDYLVYVKDVNGFSAYTLKNDPFNLLGETLLRYSISV